MITRSELLEIVYRFYPRGVLSYDHINQPPDKPVYDDTEEHRRLKAATRRGRDHYPTWDAMIRRLEDRYSLQNESLYLLSGGADPAYSARIYLPAGTEKITLTFHVSLLGPYYGIHRTGHPGEEPAASDIVREIEATYPGYVPIPPEIGNEVVPDVETNGGGFGKATIYVCVFSEVWEWAGVEPPAVPAPDP